MPEKGLKKEGMGKGKTRDQTTDDGGRTTERKKEQKSEGGIRRRWGGGILEQPVFWFGDHIYQAS